jgi:predicted deacylase
MRCLLLVLLAVGAALALELHRERWGGMFDSYTSRGDAGLTVLVVCGIHGRELITQQLCERWLEELDGMPERDDGVEPPRIIMVPAYNEAGLAIAGGRHAPPPADAGVRPTATGAEDAGPPGGTKPPNTSCWRGNRMRVDLNRNWPHLPFRSLPPADPMDEAWGGPAPLSEPETRMMKRLLEERRPTIVLAVHSGTLAMMPPYDCTDHVKPPNYQQHVRFANWLRAGICDDCVLARSTHLMYPALGTLTDYAYWEVAHLALTLEVWGNSALGADFATADCAALFNPPAHEKQAVLDKWAPLILRLATMHADDMAALQAQQQKY